MYSSPILPVVASNMKSRPNSTKVVREKFTARHFRRRRWIGGRTLAVCGVAACFVHGGVFCVRFT